MYGPLLKIDSNSLHKIENIPVIFKVSFTPVLSISDILQTSSAQNSQLTIQISIIEYYYIVHY